MGQVFILPSARRLVIPPSTPELNEDSDYAWVIKCDPVPGTDGIYTSSQAILAAGSTYTTAYKYLAPFMGTGWVITNNVNAIEIPIHTLTVGGVAVCTGVGYGSSNGAVGQSWTSAEMRQGATFGSGSGGVINSFSATYDTVSLGGATDAQIKIYEYTSGDPDSGTLVAVSEKQDMPTATTYTWSTFTAP